ncbi:hypothetical protein PENSUB_11231 [Penicillium subrubescens]|uniref:Tyrosine specific protein phosphatases domain-containing protein n=1 Tax=Penicillium subrubescens TaxID=1316194 RepID=A0A1Q5T666_9EURO|nr:hypothetical protein PENSUB_11231 [Penicillium subrubescens]
MNNIRCVCIPVVPNKEGTVKTPDETVSTIMDALMDKMSHPIIVHCNQGKHRTGCMIACFRKLQGWAAMPFSMSTEALQGRRSDPSMRPLSPHTVPRVA